MKFVELYSDGNIKNDIESDDVIIPKERKSVIIHAYSYNKYTKEYNNLLEMRRKSGLFIKKPKFRAFNTPWK